MIFQKISLPIFATVAPMVVGCSSSYFSDNSVRTVSSVGIQTAPLGRVLQSNLPSLESCSDPLNVSEHTHNSDYDIASAGIELTPADVAGVWKASIGGMKCWIATPQTRFGEGYRARPLHCPAGFSQIISWMIRGTDLMFFDNVGNTVATLYSPESVRFEGCTTTGTHVVLTR
ncbi:MAG: Outer membrane lipoprotein [Candidatus Tokpelaia sp. JSC188]|nr:MAG: Outer membrane lipoprotein [Candidatus Tokpelaia sp. JSC188]